MGEGSEEKADEGEVLRRMKRVVEETVEGENLGGLVPILFCFSKLCINVHIYKFEKNLPIMVPFRTFNKELFPNKSIFIGEVIGVAETKDSSNSPVKILLFGKSSLLKVRKGPC